MILDYDIARSFFCPDPVMMSILSKIVYQTIQSWPIKLYFKVVVALCSAKFISVENVVGSKFCNFVLFLILLHYI